MFSNNRSSSTTQQQKSSSNVQIGMGEDEYESLPAEYPITVHMIAGSVAGIVEHAAIYPADSIKTQLQSLRNTPYTGVTDAFSTMFRDGGTKRLFRGMSAMVLGAGPAHAMYFGFYEKAKQVFTNELGGPAARNSDLANGLAGACATFFHDSVMTPAEVVKQRMQMYGSTYDTCRQCMLHIYKEEGIRAFYRSFFTSLLMNIPFQSIHFITYEKAQVHMNPTREYNPMTHMVSGGLAGGTAALLTNPLDVCKTLLNTQQHEKKSIIRGLPAAFRTVYAVNGWRTFFRGVTARVLYQSPSTAVSWSVYELFKRHLLVKYREPPTDVLKDTRHIANFHKINVLPSSSDRKK